MREGCESANPDSDETWWAFSPDHSEDQWTPGRPQAPSSLWLFPFFLDRSLEFYSNSGIILENFSDCSRPGLNQHLTGSLSRVNSNKYRWSTKLCNCPTYFRGLYSEIMFYWPTLYDLMAATRFFLAACFFFVSAILRLDPRTWSRTLSTAASRLRSTRFRV